MRQSNRNFEESKSRYMKNDKKVYQLASVDENVQMLVNSQKEVLTRLLIDQKSEYDTLTRETKRKKEEEEKLKHKIDILEQMERKTSKKMEEVETANETMKNALEIKAKKKEEEIYLKKTLASQIDKIKTDTFLIRKEILNCENESRRLNHQIEKQKLKQNEIKERFNNVHSRIASQHQKNSFENNEQSLQIQYYNTIIDHKSMFIQSADERKERQKKIAQEAKNNSADQMEETKRKQFELLMLINKYLKFKMEYQLNVTAKMEETFQEIRDICGTQDMETIVDICLNKERHYNHSTALVNSQEKTRDELQNEIKKLNNELIKLKTELPVEEENEKNKAITPMEISLIEEKEKELVQSEEELYVELEKIEEKHRNIDLIFHKVVENMIMLSAMQPQLITQQSELELKENEVINTTAADNQQDTTEAEVNKTNIGDGVVDDGTNKVIEENKDNNKKQDGVEPISKPEQKKDVKLKEEELKQDNQMITTGKQKQTQLETEPIKEDPEEENQVKNTIQTTEDNLVFPAEYEDIINNFNHFLTTALRKFNILFLCHSKDEFLRIMKEKGIENQNAQLQQTLRQQLQPLSQTKKVTRVNIRKRTRRPSFQDPNADLRAHTEPNTVLIKGELIYEKEEEPMQPDEKAVFRRFAEEMKRTREDYIRNGVKMQ